MGVDLKALAAKRGEMPDVEAVKRLGRALAEGAGGWPELFGRKAREGGSSRHIRKQCSDELVGVMQQLWAPPVALPDLAVVGDNVVSTASVCGVAASFYNRGAKRRGRECRRARRCRRQRWRSRPSLAS